MAGAGSLIAANHVYKVAKPDGLTIGKFNGSLMLGQVLGQAGVEFDARKFEFVGAAVKEDVVCALTKASGITSVEKWMAAKAPVKLGRRRARRLARQLGPRPEGGARAPHPARLRLQGHRGDPPRRRRRASSPGRAGPGSRCGRPGGRRSTRETWFRSLQLTGKPFPDLPNVPLAINLAKSDEARRLIQVGLQNTGAFARPFVLPPGTPKDRVQTLRRAFQETLKDPALPRRGREGQAHPRPRDGR